MKSRVAPRPKRFRCPPLVRQRALLMAYKRSAVYIPLEDSRRAPLPQRRERVGRASRRRQRVRTTQRSVRKSSCD